MSEIKNMADELYDYWLSTHGFLCKRNEPELPSWALDINFTNIERESGKFINQNENIYFHGALAKLLPNIKQDGLKTSEGSACFTRRIKHALDGYALMGNYTMITNGSVDEAINGLKDRGLIAGKDEKELAKNAFKYWTEDKQRANLGILTIWQPPSDQIALDAKEKKIHKRHFSIYNISETQTAIERRQQIINTRGERIFLNPKYLKIIVKPTKFLREKIVELENAFAYGEDITNKSTGELEQVLNESLIYGDQKSLSKLSQDILISICESYLFSLVRASTESLQEGRIPHSRLPKLKSINTSIEYLRDYQSKTIEKIENYIAENNLQ